MARSVLAPLSLPPIEPLAAKPAARAFSVAGLGRCGHLGSMAQLQERCLLAYDGERKP